jgi:hypothetical protein
MHLHRPLRVLEQGAAHADQVEVAAVEAAQEFVQRGGLGGFAAVGARRSGPPSPPRWSVQSPRRPLPRRPERR